MRSSNFLWSPQGPSAGGSEPEYQPSGNPAEYLEETSEERRKERDSRGTNTYLSSVCKCLLNVNFNYFSICADLIDAKQLHFSKLDWTNPCNCKFCPCFTEVKR